MRLEFWLSFKARRNSTNVDGVFNIFCINLYYSCDNLGVGMLVSGMTRGNYISMVIHEYTVKRKGPNLNIITKCCKKTIAAQYIREAESDIKKRVQAFANIASDAEIQEQRSKLSPIKLQRNKVDFQEEESMALLSSPSTSSPPAGTSVSPDQTRLSELETSFEDHSSPTMANKNDVVPKDLPPNQQRLIDIMKTNLS
ncbi:hypothetical protein JD844_002522 [Phrynosoma platyrhinos]|uniref:Uncharacterized protein n=1 Tax=Phrynosoma platyrhinos TaxID=52577 RepID=A0ABQ7TC41_PHRPL|nr:hypothetical protein JD844_002522 [Phrynosoma platyrhinos]